MMEKPVILLLQEINLNSLDALASFFHNKDSGFIHRDDNDIIDNPIGTVGIAYDKKALSLTSNEMSETAGSFNQWNNA